MKIKDKRWKEFINRLAGEEGCNFREQDGKEVWNCGGGDSQVLATKILKSMGFSATEVKEILEYATEHGGHCDCEIVFNVSGL